MKYSIAATKKIRYSKGLHTVVYILVMTSFNLHGAHARAAAVSPSDYHFTAAADKFTDTSKIAVALRMRPPRRLRKKICSWQ